jgi:hypothetical protein
VVPRPQRDTRFFATRGGAVLLSGIEGRMYALDPASALCWLSLDAADPQREALLALQEEAGLSPVAAEAWHAVALRQFAEAGLLEGTTPAEAAAPVTLPPPRADCHLPPLDAVVTLHGRLAGLAFTLAVPRDLAELAKGLLSPALADEAAADTSPLMLHHIDGTFLLAGPNRVLAETHPGLDAALAVELLLVDLAIRRTPHLAALHAALLGHGSAGLLITGVSGAGKTTLSATLAASGWRYGGDERVLLSADATTVIPLPTAPCVKTGAVPALRRFFPALDRAAEHPRAGRSVRYLNLPATEQSPMTVRAVVFPERTDAAVPALHEIAPLEGLRRLMNQCLRVPRGFGPAEVQRLLNWHDGITYLGLRYSEAATAVPLLERLLTSS